MGSDLELCLKWWHEVLQLEICQLRPWAVPHRQPLQLFADARSTPPRVAAVLIRQGPQYLCVQSRCGQIMGLEIVAVALGSFVFVILLQHSLPAC